VDPAWRAPSPVGWEPLPPLAPGPERVRSRTHLHEALKRIYATGGGETECAVGPFFVDARREGLLIEVQTANLSGLRPKLERLLAGGHRVLVVVPLAVEKEIVRLERRGGPVRSRRRSPRRGRWVEAFDELVFLKQTLAHPLLRVHLLLTAEEEWRVGGSRRYRVADRRLLRVVGGREFSSAGDWKALLPPGLPRPFQSRHLASALRVRRFRAQAMLYVLAAAGAVRRIGRDRRGVWFHPATMT
jgi:hypothetical protein